MPESFGKDRYYSKHSTPENLNERSDKADEAGEFFEDVLGAGERKEKVEAAVGRWKANTREKVRVATKLKFSYDGAQESVPVEVKDGVPPPFVELYEKHPDSLVWRLLLKRSKLESTVEVLDLVGLDVRLLKKRFESLAQLDADQGDLASSRELIEALLKKLQESSIMKSFRSIERDALGAYFFRVPAIQIYWLPIAVTAEALNVSLEALTVVTLLHERVHAYTHLGFDTDGAQWPTSAFAEADLPVIEGLAQYYTWAICSEVEEKYPTWIEAFNQLLDFQPDPYRAHRDWDPKSERAGEVVRGAMISARAKPIQDIIDFEVALRRVRSQLEE